MKNKEMKKVASDIDEFIVKIAKAGTKVLENEKINKLINDTVIIPALEKNPNISGEEIQKLRTDLLTTFILITINENKNLKNELAEHVYNYYNNL